jgi:hypothetical protein
MKYRNVNFEVDLVAMDAWRWTILPRSTRDQTVAHCMAEIDAMLARENA